MGFPEGFVWGAAASSFQNEGAAYEDGKGLSVWDMAARWEGKIWSKRPPNRIRIRADGVIHYKSSSFRQKSVLPPEGASFAGVPMLVVNGQYEALGPENVEQPDEKDSRLDRRYGRETQWISMRADIQEFRKRDANHLMSLVLDPGGDHLFGSKEVWDLAAQFISNTARLRIPAESPAGGDSVRCLSLKAADGWLTDADLMTAGNRTAAYDRYKGDKASAFWHYNHEAVEADVRHHRNMGATQCLEAPGFTWLDEGDGWTFRAQSQWLDTMPGFYGGPSAGKDVGHSTQPFVFRSFTFRCRSGDPVVQVGPDTFRLLRPGSVAIAAVHPGDAVFRAVNRWAQLTPPPVKGENQTIAFEPVPDLKPGGPGVDLKATASSGLPVYYEVEYGPVTLDDGKVRVSDLPSSPQYPIECRVTAWQIGRRVGKPVAPALPVSRTFSVVAP